MKSPSLRVLPVVPGQVYPPPLPQPKTSLLENHLHKTVSALGWFVSSFFAEHKQTWHSAPINNYTVGRRACTCPIKMVLCDACGGSFKRSGIVQHSRMSRNPACRKFWRDLRVLDAAKGVSQHDRTLRKTGKPSNLPPALGL